MTLKTSLDSKLVEKFKKASQKKLNIDDFVSEFLGEFLSSDTKKAYIKDLAFFFQFLRSGGVIISSPSEIQSYHFQLYRDHLIEKNLSSATINRRLVAVRSFIKWAVSVRILDHNPLDAIKLPKVQTEAPTNAFEDHEVVQMINAPHLENYKGKMHRFVMVLLFNLGLRRSELTNLKLSDIYEERGHSVLKVHGKGDKVRLIPLNQFIQHEIQAYLNQFEPQLTANDYLIQTEREKRNSKPIDGSTIYRVINKYARDLNINKQVSPHSCRATVISHLLDTQMTPIRDVASFAGHTNITTTERYDKRRKNLDNNPAYDVDYDSIKKVI